MNQQPAYDRKLLMCHTGKADYVTRNEIPAIETPEIMGPRHHPVSFYDFIMRVMSHMEQLKWNVDAEAHVINDDGKKFFSTFAVSRPNKWTDHLPSSRTWQQLVGLRGSHDQTLPRGMVFGNRVFVCDNLMFTGSSGSFHTKQTTFIEDRLDQAIVESLNLLDGIFQATEQRFKRYTVSELSNSDANDIFALAYRSDALTGSSLGATIDEWDKPSVTPELNEGTVWGALNAMTFAIKEQTKNNLHLQQRTKIASDLIEHYCPA